MGKKLKLGLDISEKEYRALPLPSYSLLSDIQKLYEKGLEDSFSLKPSNNYDTDGIIVGSITDTIISDGNLPENLITVKKKPSGKMKEMINCLLEMKEFLHEDILNEDNYKAILIIAEKFKYKKTDEDRIKGFLNYREYIELLFNLDKPENYLITTDYTLFTAKRTANNILDNFPILRKDFDNDIDLFFQVKITGEFNDIQVKCMLDAVIINHNKKIIIPIDIKSGANKAEEFYDKCYLGWNYYIQSSLYRKLLIDYIRENHKEFDSYTVVPFSFIYGSRMNNDVVRYDVQEDEHVTSLYEGYNLDSLEKLSVESLLDIFKRNLPSEYNVYINS